MEGLTAGVLNGQGEVHTKCEITLGIIYTKISSVREAACQQGMTNEVESFQRLTCINGRFLMRLLSVMTFMQR